MASPCHPYSVKMCPLVLGTVTGVAESLLAAWVLAQVRLLTRVLPHVHLQLVLSEGGARSAGTWETPMPHPSTCLPCSQASEPGGTGDPAKQTNSMGQSWHLALLCNAEKYSTSLSGLFISTARQGCRARRGANISDSLGACWRAGQDCDRY